MQASHPFGVASGKVIVHRHHMDALALDRIEVGGQRGDQRLALARPHLGNLAAMQHDPAHHLDIEMAHAEHADRRFTNGGECFGEDIVERLAIGQLTAELVGLCCQLLVAQRL